MCVLTNVTTLVLKGGYLGLTENQNMNYFERSKGSYINLFQPYARQVLNDQKTYFAVFHNMTLEKCALFCLLETRDTCMSFSFSEKKHVCGLSKVFYTDDNGQKLVSSSDYNHYQYFSSWPCNATIPWNYSPRAIASPYFPYASVKDVNCHLKIEAPLGKQVDLVFSTFFTQDNLCRHQDGGITVHDGTSGSSAVLSRLCTSENFVNRRYQSSNGYLYIIFATDKIPMAFKAVYDFIEVDPCLSSPCKNNGTCHSNEALFTCTCMAGYTGNVCETDIDECASSPCLMGGFTGVQCETNINDCASHPCYHNIPCIDLVDDYRCECPPFMAGKGCEQFVGRCSENPCHHGTCIPTGRYNYTCACDTSYTGSQCDSLFINYCDPNPCKHGKCSSFSDGPSCECDFGYKGFLCDQRINYCEGISCTHGECINRDDGFQCKCLPGYQGIYCNETINHCLEANCDGGYCINTMTSFFCVCSGGKTGRTCNTDSRVCDGTVCKNGTCDLVNGVSVCKCNTDFTGTECDSPIDYCITQPCERGTCTSIHGGFKCTCEDNYTGERCNNEIDYCKTNKCVYGLCQNLENSFQCICAEGYHGNLCQYKPNEVESTSTTLQYLSTTVSQNPHIHTLTSTTPIYTTSRTPALKAPGVYICTMKTCKHGICEPDFPNVCLCLPGFTGDTCDIFKGCSKYNPCHNGKCFDTSNGFRCLCEKGFVGEMCERENSGKSAICKFIKGRVKPLRLTTH
ncbi:fibropellin-1-like [Mercenaria mercenaria]|uniref:fibropellin-1-like n=1 Tax=Mercenaria mercenaria TaxID=6596 RepID=UPI00234E4201|nr:fibropellin-1-like [Mercenaria mercenaria]